MDFGSRWDLAVWMPRFFLRVKSFRSLEEGKLLQHFCRALGSHSLDVQPKVSPKSSKLILGAQACSTILSCVRLQSITKPVIRWVYFETELDSDFMSLSDTHTVLLAILIFACGVVACHEVKGLARRCLVCLDGRCSLINT